MSKQTILILGAKGMLGQALVDAYSDSEKYTVYPWDKEDVNVTDLKMLHKKINELWPDVIYNTVAYNNVDLCETDDQEYEKALLLNSVVPEEIAKIARELQAIFIHYSTDYVFNGKRPRGVGNSRPKGCCGSGCSGCNYNGVRESIDHFSYREGDQTCPINRYGKSKSDGERRVQNSGGTLYYIIRLSRLFGRPGISSGSKKSFFDIMHDLASKNSEVKVVNQEIACFTYAPDLAQKSKEIIETFDEKGNKKYESGIYHITNSNQCTWYEATCELYKLLNKDIKIIPIMSTDLKRSAKRPCSSVLMSTEIDPLRSYKDALKEYLIIKNN